MKSKHVLLVALVASIGVGCAIDTPAGSAGWPEKYVVYPIDLATIGRTVASEDDAHDPAYAAQMQAHLLLDAGEANSDVVNIALTGQHLYFAVSWEGIYRIPKHGGDVEVVDAGAMRAFASLSADNEEVFWTRTAFDNRDYPSVEIKRRADAGGPIALLFSGPWGTTGGAGKNFQADPTGLFFVGSLAGAAMSHLYQMPREGGQPKRVLRFEDSWPTWRRDAGQLFYATGSPFSPRDSHVYVLSDGQTEPRLLAALPTGRAVLHDVDATSLYLSDWKTIWQVGKADGIVTELGTGEGIDSVIVDDKRVYFVSWSSTGEGASVRSIGRADGSNTIVASGTQVAGIRQLAQDDSLIYLLHGNGYKVSVVAKPRGP